MASIKFGSEGLRLGMKPGDFKVPEFNFKEFGRKRGPKRPAAAPRPKAKGKKAVNGSQKGAAFERSIAKQFSLWISGGASQDLLWRSAGSGGRSTQRRKQTGKGIEYHASDIAPLHPDAAPFVDVFTLECKFYKSIELRQVIYDWDASVVGKWWARARIDAASVKRVPLLVMKENLKPAMLVMPAPRAHPYFGRVDPFIHVTEVYTSGVVIVPLEDILGTVPFAQFRNLYVPGDHQHRPAPDRQRTGRVPLVDL